MEIKSQALVDVVEDENPSAAPRRIADKLGVSARLARSGLVDWNN